MKYENLFIIVNCYCYQLAVSSFPEILLS